MRSGRTIARPDDRIEGLRLTGLWSVDVPLLRRLHLATDHPATVLRAADGTIVELFEWVSAAAMATAHEDPEVLAMWARYAECSDYSTLAELPNAATMFAEFEHVGTY